MEDESMESFLTNDKVIAVVNLLTKFRIKLWELKDLSLPESQKEVEELLMKLSDESGLVENEIKSILIRLQQHSLRKLAENKRFNEEKIAVFKLKIIGNLNKNQQEKISTDNFEASINLTGLELSNLIKATFDLNCDSLKVICNGKVLKDDSLLSSQDIKNHSTLMAMCVYYKLSQEMASNAADYKLISDIKDAVSFLTDQRQKGYDIGLDEFKLSNQNGRSIDISPSDTRTLTSAMILHEKAKNLMKSKDHLKALILLAEADNEFKNCSDRSLLERVDNYALLNLDIIWCYLCLENLNELKNAEERLQVCESCLKKCYGSDLERLSKIKGETINKHTPIFVRINLLNAILQYHKGKKRECREYLDIASRELKKISIDEDKLVQVMSMGFSSTEARLALRASFNNVDEAIEQILKKRREKEAAKKIEKEKDREEKLSRKYGRTLENKTIDTKLLDDLVQLGYAEKEAAIALVRANNNFQIALDLMPSIISELESQPCTSSSFTGLSENANIDNIDLSQLSALGFDLDLCKKALDAFQSNLEKAANFLLENRSESETGELKQKLEGLLEKTTNLPKTAESKLEMHKKTVEAQSLLSKLSSEIPEDDEAYLDLNTDEDAFYINKYYSLLD